MLAFKNSFAITISSLGSRKSVNNQPLSYDLALKRMMGKIAKTICDKG